MFARRLIGQSGLRTNGHPTRVAGESIRCVQGANEQNLPIHGRTVAWARTNLSSALNISPVAVALVDGIRVGEDHALELGSVLEFLAVAGRKGVSRVWTIEQFCELFQIEVAQLEHLLLLGLPHLRWPDGTLRIPEVQVDRFLDQHLGLVLRPNSVPPECLSPPDAAAFLGIQPETLEHLRKSRKIRAIQVGDQRGFVFSIADLRDFAGRRAVPTGEEERKRRSRR
jgi:hypothetical protein